MPLPGDILEELDSLVQRYNKAFLDEKAAAKNKQDAVDTMLDILRHYRCSSAEAGGCTLTVRPWTRQSLVYAEAQKLLSAEQLGQITKVSTGISLDVRPLRSQ